MEFDGLHANPAGEIESSGELHRSPPPSSLSRAEMQLDQAHSRDSQLPNASVSLPLRSIAEKFECEGRCRSEL